MLSGTGAIVSRGLARDMRLSVGGTLVLPTALGERRLAVVDVVDFLSLESGMVVISLTHLQEWYQRDGATWLEVQIDPDADHGAVRAQLERVNDTYPNRLYVVSGAEERRGGEQAAQQASALTLVLLWMVAVSAGLTLLNTLLLSVLERRRQIAVLRAVGASRRLIRHMVLLEGFGMAAVGSIVGLLIGVPLQYVVTTGLSRVAAVDVPFRLASGSLLMAMGVLVVALLALISPVRQASRTDLALALNEE